MKPWRLTVLILLPAASWAQIPFKLDVLWPVLSNHQRLQATIQVKIDGAELAKRRGDGDLLIKFEVHDQQGRPYTTDGKIDLREVNKDTSKSNIFFSHDVFVTPGSYHVLAQLTDTITGQQGSAEKNFRVEPLAGDPFPDMWRDLPPVEFWPGGDGFEHWFAPSLKQRLHLTLDTQQPVKIDLLVNTTPSEITLRRRDATLHGDQNMSAVIPAMKTIFQTEVRNGSLGVTLLDLSRQRVIFSQDNRREMDWPRLKQSVEGGDPNKIDVHSLANRENEGDFFVATVGAFLERALAAGEPKHVLIVLSGVMGFREGVPLHPIESKGNANCMVFYIRYSAHGPFVTNGFEARSPVPPRRATSPTAPRTGWMEFDQLAGTLKPLNPRLYDISSPMGFRKALANIYAEISR